MATDNFGREISGTSPQEIAHQMQDPVKQAGAGDIVSAINQLISSQKDANKKIDSAMRSAISTNGLLAKKLDEIKDTLDHHLSAARGFNTKVKEARTDRPKLTDVGIGKVLKDQMKPSKELKQIHETITSKNTVHVKEKELRKLTGHLIKAIQSLASAIDPKKSRPISEAPTPRAKKASHLVLPDDGFMKDESKRPTKAGSPDWLEKIIRAEAKRLFNVKDFRYAAPGEGGIQHRAFNEQIKKLSQGGSVADLKRIVELEEGRIRNSKLFANYQKEILKLRQNIVEAKTEETLKKGADAYYNRVEEILKQQEKWELQILGLAKEVSQLSTKAYEVGYGFNFMQKATEGVIANERKLIQEAGELAALQQTSAKHIRNQEIYVSKLTTSSRAWFMQNQAVARTGKKQVEVELQQYKNQRKGIKDTELATKLAEKGLALSTALGSNAEQTSEQFRSWHMEMGLSTKELGQMSIGIKGVANSTGLVGDELLKVVENTKKAMNNMRDLGTLTSEAAIKLVEMNAEAQKLGVGGRAAEINEYLTTGVKKLGSKLTPFMVQSLQQGINKIKIDPAEGAEMMQQLQHGQLLNNPKGMKAWVEGAKEVRNQIAGSNKSIKEMTNEELRLANLNAQAYGYEGIGELDRVIKYQEKSLRSYTERLTELQKEREGINLKELDKIQKANLLMKESTLKFSESTKLLSRLNDRGVLQPEEAKDFHIDKATTPQQKKALAEQTLKSYQAGREQAIAAGANKANLGPGLTKKDLSQAKKTGNYEKFLEVATTADQQLQNEMVNLSNPITQQLTELKHINSFLQSTFGGFATWLTQNSLVRTITGIGGLVTTISSMTSAFSRHFPRLTAAGEQTSLYLGKMTSKMLNPGSIYVHDIHVEKLLRHMNRQGTSSGGIGNDGVGNDISSSHRSPDWLRKARKGRKSAVQIKGGLWMNKMGRKMPWLGKLSRGGLSKIGGLAGAGGLLGDGLSMLGIDLPGAEYLDTAADVGDYANTAKDFIPKGMMRKAGATFGRGLKYGKGLLGGSAGRGLMGRGASLLSKGKGLLGGSAGKGLMGRGASLLSKGKGLLGMGGTSGGAAGGAGVTAGGAATAAGAAYGLYALGDLLWSSLEVAKKPSVLNERSQEQGQARADNGAFGYGQNVVGNLARPGMAMLDLQKAQYNIATEAPGAVTGALGWQFGKKAREGKEKAWAVDEKNFYKIVEDLGAKGNLTPKEQGLLEMAQTNLARMAVESKGKFGAHPPAPKPNAGISSISATASPTPPSTISTNLSSMGVGNIEQRVKAEEVSKNSDKASSSMVSNLSGVESNTAESTEQLKILVAQIKTLLTVITTGGSEPGKLNTKTNTQPNILPNYYTWNTGDYSTLPSKGPVLPSV
jgi:hypothetical protein